MTELLPDSGADAMLHDKRERLDPLGDIREGSKNRAKVGSARPSSLLYTYGPGAIMDLPGFSVMPAGLDDWEAIWKRRGHVEPIVEPRLLEAVRTQLKHRVEDLRPFPWQPKRMGGADEGADLGVPARVFPQWFRCTGCNLLGPLSRLTYTNTHPYRPDRAQFTHPNCPGRGGASRSRFGSPAVPAQHLLTCSNGHLDEFPYSLWVHRGAPCREAPNPDLKMRDANVGKSVGSFVQCVACGLSRGMSEAQGPVNREKLPQTCRGRHPHLNAFDRECGAAPTLIMMGASNLWFASTQSVIVMPRTEQEEQQALVDRLRNGIDADRLEKRREQIDVIRDLADEKKIDLQGVSDAEIAVAVALALEPQDSDEEQRKKQSDWDPIELLVPEWRYLQAPEKFPQQQSSSGLMVTEMVRDPNLNSGISRVIAVNKMKKVNAVIGFTRLDEMERATDLPARLVKLTRSGRPSWVPATEDRGEGIFLQLDLDAVAEWEQQVLATRLWSEHRESHRRNFARRFSETAKDVDPDDRLPAPRYWLLHSFSHALIRAMAMSSGYGAASLSERIYGWPASPDRGAAAGVLICTTASDSDGTLGGLVELSEPPKLAALVEFALRRAARCSSDPVCATRTPSDPEDFLHGAACHSCSFASETSCEKANRFLDRRFLLDLPMTTGETVRGFFGSIDVY